MCWVTVINLLYYNLDSLRPRRRIKMRRIGGISRIIYTPSVNLTGDFYGTIEKFVIIQTNTLAFQRKINFGFPINVHY